VLLGISQTPALCLVAPGMIIVPGVTLVNALQDMIKKHMTVGLARLGLGSLVTLAIAFGLSDHGRLIQPGFRSSSLSEAFRTKKTGGVLKDLSEAAIPFARRFARPLSWLLASCFSLHRLPPRNPRATTVAVEA
jgi:hypothetical protein